MEILDNYLSLKWGRVNGYRIKDKNCKAWKLLKKFWNQAQHYRDPLTEEQKQLLCQLIDEFNGKIYDDWYDEELNKEEAKKYILEY